MEALREQQIHCPYCGESISILIDLTQREQEYVEDCSVCCRPMVIGISESHDGDVIVEVHSENESHW